MTEAPSIAFEFRSRPCLGQAVSGDEVVFRSQGSRCLIAVVDALGHGPHAHRTARVAAEFLEQCDMDQDPVEILRGLDRALARTRGVAAAVCVHDGDVVHCGGVGNVELRSVGSSVGLVSTPGVLGRRPRRLRISTSSVRRGDRFALFSDGVSARIHLPDVQEVPLGEACDRLFERYSESSDDATLVLCDVVSAGGPC